MILFIDNKQTPYKDFRKPRYFLFKDILHSEGIESFVIGGSWHHGTKKRILTPKNKKAYSLINTVSYENHLGVRRMLSEFFFGFQVIFKHLSLLKKAKLIVINDSGIFYNYIFYIFKYIFKYKIVLDSNDLWPEIFIKKDYKFAFKIIYKLKKILYRNSDYFISVNEEYYKHYKYLNSKKGGVINLGLTIKELDKIKCNLFDSNVRRLLYLGSLGVNYIIEDVCEFVLANKEYEIDFFGTGVKDYIVSEYTKKSKGRIKLYPPRSLEYFKDAKIKYCMGVALYSPSSLVKFPTKLYDYWAFSLPVIVNVGEDVKKMLINNQSLGLFLNNREVLTSELILNVIQSYEIDGINKSDIIINNRVLNLFKDFLKN
jgi:hypothetical protein